VFRDYYELQLGMVLCAVLILAAILRDGELAWFRSWKQRTPLVGMVFTVALAAYLGYQVREFDKGSRVIVRNFYGVLKVSDSGPEDSLNAIRTLTHGTIWHGREFLHPSRRNVPTTYYGPFTGIGIAIRDKQQAGPMKVGVVGLGAGTLAAYSRPGDTYRFYEINPLVIELARTQFYYLQSSPAKLYAARGDGRLTMEREEPQNYDVLAIDAFSGDAIPVHLLTREAMALYFRHLKPDGVLAVHISNRYVDLAPVVAAVSKAAGKSVRLVNTPGGENEVVAASWMLLTADPGAKAGAGESTTRIWTDDYSNLFQALK